MFVDRFAIWCSPSVEDQRLRQIGFPSRLVVAIESDCDIMPRLRVAGERGQLRLAGFADVQMLAAARNRSLASSSDSSRCSSGGDKCCWRHAIVWLSIVHVRYSGC